MKKLIICATVAVAAAVSIKFATTNVGAIETTAKTVKVDSSIANKVDSSTANVDSSTANNTPKNNTLRSVDEQIRAVYNKIAFKGAKLNFDVFKKAYTGYANLKSAGKVNSNKDILTVADFSKRSSEKRLWVIDLNKNKVLFHDYVAHGQGSGGAMATKFSNTNNSHQSSLGFYVTGNTYVGKHGRSLKMHGMDHGFNHSALARAVVIHAAKYVSAARAATGSIGRSWGCPAVSEKIAQPMISAIKGGTVLFVYAPQANYLKKSTWLNKKLDQKQLALNAPVKGNSVAIS